MTLLLRRVTAGTWTTEQIGSQMVIYGARAGLSCEHTGPVAVWTLRCGLATTWILGSVGSLWCHKATACHGDITAMARLPHGSSQVAIGLSVYVRSIYKKMGKSSPALNAGEDAVHYGLRSLKRISIVFHRSLTVPSHSPNGRQIAWG